MLGWGCLNPPNIYWDSPEFKLFYDVTQTSYEANPNYIVIPIAVDDKFLQVSWNLPSLPYGLPHIEPRTAQAVPRCQWWPGVGKDGVWVDRRIVSTWEILRQFAEARGVQLPEGEPIFVCDWD